MYLLDAPLKTSHISKKSVGHRFTAVTGTAKHLDARMSNAHAVRRRSTLFSCICISFGGFVTAQKKLNAFSVFAVRLLPHFDKNYFLDSSKERFLYSFINFSTANDALRARVPAALLPFPTCRAASFANAS